MIALTIQFTLSCIWTPLQSQNGGNGFNLGCSGNWWTGKSGVYMNGMILQATKVSELVKTDGNVTALRTFENPLNSGRDI